MDDRAPTVSDAAATAAAGIRLSDRVRRMRPSSTLALSARVKQLKAEGRDVIGFAAGEPDFDTPAPLVEVAIEALRSGRTRYEPVPGPPATRRAVAERLAARHGMSCAAEDVLITVGGKSAIFFALLAVIEDYEAILADDARVRAIIREDCLEVKQRHATPRLTSIEDAESEDLEVGDLIAEHECVVTVSHAGYIKRVPVDTYREQGRGGRGVKGSVSRDGDFISRVFVSSSHDDLLCFTNTGRVFRKKVFQIPEMSRTSQGRAIVNLLELREDERVVAFLTIADFERSEDYLFFATSSGRVKRTSLKDFRNVNRSGIIAVNLNEDDRLIDVVYTTGNDHVLLSTARGMAIRFDENDARVMGRSAAGVKGIDLADDDEVIGLVRAEAGADLLTVTERGYGKRTPIDEYLVQSESGVRPQSRGGKGRIDIRTTARNGRAVAVLAVREDDGLMFVTERGLIVRIAAESVRQTGRGTQGVRVVNLKEGDRLISMARVAESGDEEADGGEEPVDG